MYLEILNIPTTLLSHILSIWKLKAEHIRIRNRSQHMETSSSSCLSHPIASIEQTSFASKIGSSKSGTRNEKFLMYTIQLSSAKTRHFSFSLPFYPQINHHIISTLIESSKTWQDTTSLRGSCRGIRKSSFFRLPSLSSNILLALLLVLR